MASSRQDWVLNAHVTLKFGWQLGNSIVKIAAKKHGKIKNTKLVTSSLLEIMHWDIETATWGRLE